MSDFEPAEPIFPAAVPCDHARRTCEEIGCEAPTPPTEEPHDDDLASEPEFGRVSPDTLTLIEGATSHSFSGLSRAFAVTFEDEPDELEALRDRQDILTLAQHCKTYADGDVYLAATRVLHLFRAADPFAAYERVVAERDEAQRARIALKQTIDAFPDANNAANLAHARAERDRLRSDLSQATAVVEAAESWFLHGDNDATHSRLIAAVDAYRANRAPTGGVEG